jgi:hypothetical protein
MFLRTQVRAAAHIGVIYVRGASRVVAAKLNRGFSEMATTSEFKCHHGRGLGERVMQRSMSSRTTFIVFVLFYNLHLSDFQHYW